MKTSLTVVGGSQPEPPRDDPDRNPYPYKALAQIEREIDDDEFGYIEEVRNLQYQWNFKSSQYFMNSDEVDVTDLLKGIEDWRTRLQSLFPGENIFGPVSVAEITFRFYILFKGLDVSLADPKAFSEHLLQLVDAKQPYPMALAAACRQVAEKVSGKMSFTDVLKPLNDHQIKWHRRLKIFHHPIQQQADDIREALKKAEDFAQKRLLYNLRDDGHNKLAARLESGALWEQLTDKERAIVNFYDRDLSNYEQEVDEAMTKWEAHREEENPHARAGEGEAQ